MAERLTPFGKYFLIERINVGGMAEVFKAKTVGVEGFEKIVAIKRILPSVAEDEEFIRMFVDEAKITSQLSHANLAQTFDLGRINDTYYIAMEYVPGKDLRAVFERLKRRGERMPIGLAAYAVARVCEGLDYAHRKRDLAGRDLHIVHRDVSPQNVILSFEGEVKLIDFGIAKAANKMTKTQAGILKGKFGYMSPEQVRGLELDRRSDIFAAGIVLYEVCTGERLFTGNSDYSVLEKVQQAKVTPPSSVEPSIPLKLERVILKALAREPEDRYQHAADLAADLTRFLMEQPQHAVTRDDVSAFMKSMFPDDNAREAQLVLENTGPKEQRRPPPEVAREPRRPALERRPPPQLQDLAARKTEPPLLPASLTADLAEPEGVLGENDPDATFRGPAPVGPPAEIIVRSKVEAQKAARLAAGGAAGAPLDEAPIQPGDSPTRPMSMDELAAAERQLVQQQKLAAPPSVEVLDDDDTTPGAPLPFSKQPALGEHDDPTPVERPRDEPARPVEATPVRSPPPVLAARRAPAAGLAAAETPAAVRSRPPPPPADAEPPTALPDSLFADLAAELPAQPTAGAPPLRAEPPVARLRNGGALAGPHRPAADDPPPLSRHDRTEPRAMQLPALPDAPAADGPEPKPEAELSLNDQRTQLRKRPLPDRMHLGRPALVGEEPASPDENTSSSLTGRARWLRRVQLAVLGVALAVAGWALFSSPRSSRRSPSGAPLMASVTVSTEPPDAVLLLDGAQVKDAADKEWTEPKLTAGVEHVLTARRSGFAEHALPVTLRPGETRTVTIQLQPLQGELIVRSSPPGALVYVDGERRGATPAYLPNLDVAAAHAVVLEKKCYRTWQVAVPAHAGRRELAASLEPAVAACPGRRLEKSEGMPAPEAADETATTLGFLSLGSRPSSSVVIDGVDIGRQTPLLSWPLKSGEHRVRVGARDLTVQIRSGETHSEIVDLESAKKRGRR